MPVYQIGKFLRTPGRLRKVKKARAAAFAAAAIALVAGILLIPTPLRVQGTLVLKLAKPEEVYAEVEGRLVELNVENGDWVTKDTVLAKLSNPEKQKELLQNAAGPRGQLPKASWYRPEPRAREPGAGQAARARCREARADDREDHRADRQADPDRQPRRPGRRRRRTTRRSASGSSRASRSARSATRISWKPT